MVLEQIDRSSFPISWRNKTILDYCSEMKMFCKMFNRSVSCATGFIPEGSVNCKRLGVVVLQGFLTRMVYLKHDIYIGEIHHSGWKPSISN